MSDIYSVILAAGKGTRMKSNLLKVLHQIDGKPMVSHIIDTLNEIKIKDIVIVVGHQSEEVINTLGDKLKYVHQEQQLGTGHAVLQAKGLLKDKKGITLVLSGDAPLLTTETINSLIEEHEKTNVAATILTTEIDVPTGYGRIIRDNNRKVMKIVEEKDTTIEEKQVKEINTGIYCFDNEKLFDAIDKISNNNKQNEYYLTDVIEILRSQGYQVGAYLSKDPSETIGINDRIALSEAEKIFRNRILEKHMRQGVTIIDPTNTYIGKEVIIEFDTIIHPNTFLRGKTTIGANCVIGPNTEIADTKIGNGVTITHSVINSSTLNNNSIIGPFAYIRPNCNIEDSVKIGDFVEVKNSKIGRGTKIPHLSYIGDADLGENVNIGSGTITVNYDGVQKHRTKIGDRSFVGCNTNLVAPVTLGNDTYIAAGSTITDDVPDFSLSIARQKQTNKENYVKKLREKKQSKS